ncbi:MAG: SRPBCC family protein [Acidimicrobiia bacterium]
MEILEEFRVPLPVDEAWRLLLDIERIAPCMPGAQLQEIEGDEYRGVVKVKVGPITAQYKGTAKLESTDDAAHTAVLVASGRDTRGQGNASATIQLSLAAEGDRTLVSVETDLAITGKVAQFGRGVLNDVSGKLLAQFVENLERDLLSGDTPQPEPQPEPAAEAAPEPVPRSAPRPAAESASEPLVADVTTNGSARAPAGEIRRIDAPDAAPVDLLAVSGQPVGKRLLPVAVLLLLLLVLLGIRRRRSRGRGRS